MTDEQLTEIRTRLAVVQSRLRNNYFADPDDCVWAVEHISVLVGEVERLRVLAGEASPREVLGLPDD